MTEAVDTFEWLPSESAHARYPMQLVYGELSLGDEVITPIPTGKILNEGWGELGSLRDVGEVLKPVPDRLDLAWYSFTEDQLFAGTVELPRARLLELFRQGFEVPQIGGRGQWSTIIVGMGLGGWVSVWLAGESLVRELTTATVEPGEFEWREVLDNAAIERSSYVRSVLWERLTKAQIEAHEKHGPPVASFPRYARRQLWRLQVEGLLVPLDVFVRSFNGEHQFFALGKRAPVELDALPKHLAVTWLRRDRSKIITRLALPEAEVFDAFDRAAAQGPDVPAPTLHVEIGARYQVSVTLSTAEGRIALRGASAEVRKLAG